MENGKEYSLPSGAKLYVSVSPYGQVIDLHDALVAELRGRGVGTLDVVEINRVISGESEEGLNVLVDKMLGLAASKEFKAAIFTCAQQAVYRPDGTEASSIKFKLGTPGYGVFDDPACMGQAREDFYGICRAIVEENLRPFGKALFSMFMAHVAKRADTRESNTAKEPPKPTL